MPGDVGAGSGESFRIDLAAQRDLFRETELRLAASDAKVLFDSLDGAHYRLVADSEVPAGLQRAARWATELATDDLKLSPFALEWLEPISGTAWRAAVADGDASVIRQDFSIRGHALPGRRLIRVTISGADPADVALTVFHECRHLVQAAGTQPEREADAAAYTARWSSVARLIGLVVTAAQLNATPSAGERTETE